MKSHDQFIIKCVLLVYLVPSLCYSLRVVSPNQDAPEKEENSSSGQTELMQNEFKQLGAQFVAEPDDYQDLEDSLPSIQRNIIREFYNLHDTIGPDAIRYINDEESLPALQQMLFQEYNQLSSTAVPKAIRYTSDAAQDAIHKIDEEIAGQLNNMMYFGRDGKHDMPKALIEDDTGKGNSRKNSGAGLKYTNNESGFETVSPFFTSSQQMKGLEEADLPTSTRKETDEKLRPGQTDVPGRYGAVRKTDSKGKDIQELGALVEQHKKQKHHRRHHHKKRQFQKSHHQKSSLSAANTGSTSSIMDASEGIRNTTKRSKIEFEMPKHNDVKTKREVHRSSKKRHFNSSDEMIKRTTIFNDIAAAFKHMAQNNNFTSRQASKKSLLPAHEKDIENKNKISRKPVNGGFTSWTDWSDCSETCGTNAIKMRMRVCTNPPPANGGQDCKGWRFEVKYCPLAECRDDISSSSNITEGVESEKEKNDPNIKKPEQDAATEEQHENTTTNSAPISRENSTIHTLDDKEEHGATSHPLAQDAPNTPNTDNRIKEQSAKNSETSTPVSKPDSKENRLVEKMFKEVVHRAFDKAKKKQQQGTLENKTTNTESPPIPIHSNPGLIPSENKIDTIDDAPDTSQLDNQGISSQNETENSQNHIPKAKSSHQNESLKDGNVSSEKLQPQSIDGGHDSVMELPDNNKEYSEKEDFNITLLAQEILKNNDPDAVLKALTEEKNAETIASYPDTASTNNHQSLSGTDEEASNHGNVQTIENEEKNEASDISSSENSNTNIISKSVDEDKDNENKIQSDDKIVSDNTVGDSEDIRTAVRELNQMQNSVSNITNESDEDSELDDSGKNSTSEKQPQESFDSGNLHALNALVEILAQHEKNESKKNNTTEGNSTLPEQNNATNLNSNNTEESNSSAVLNNTINELVSSGAISPEPSNNTVNSTGHSNPNKPNSYTNKAKIQEGNSGNGNIASLDNYAIGRGRKRFNVSGEGRHDYQPGKADIPGNGTHEFSDDIENQKNRNSSKGTHNKGKNNSLFNVLKEVINTITRIRPTPANSTRGQMNNSSSKEEDSEEQGSQIRSRSCLSPKDTLCEGLLKQNKSCHLVNCPVDGGMTEWSQWSSCTASCGEGAYKVRNRTCTSPIGRFGGKPCTGPFVEKEDCHLKSCVKFVIAGKIGNETVMPNHKEIKHEKGVWGPWSAWTKCSRTCGGSGFTKRQRSCLPGKNCIGPQYDTMECVTEPCPVDGGYTVWTQWSPCTPTCGLRAYRLRRRYCTNPPPSHGGAHCYDSSLETEPCKTVKCPVDGGFTDWSSWSPCSKSCNSTAFSRRERHCTKPEPSGGGKPCQGNSTEVKECGKEPCPIDGGVTEWSAWTKCPNLTCGSKFHQKRVRSCENPKPQFGGKDCKEGLLEERRCMLPSCPVDGAFSDWSSWSTCPEKCKPSALSHRRRHCNNPKPKNGGRHCIGNHFETRPCANINCPVAGGFTSWSQWSGCTKECDHTSIRTRERYCTNPAPLNGGTPCIGSKFQISVCKTDGCPRNGNFTAWSEWTDCPKCGKGLRKRMRTCTNPPPLNGGKNCEGPSIETVACPFKECEDAGFSQWSSYGRCSRSCGGGAKMRRRTCNEETQGCDGKHVELKPCNTHSCVLGNSDPYHPTPTSVCGFNPCKMSKCLGRDDALCVTSNKCQPVFFDKQENIIESCQGDLTVLTSSPNGICGFDPCQASGCYTDEASKCYVTNGCEPLFVDSKGKKLHCRGLLKVPPSLVCGIDPCEGRSCELDSDARCVADVSCSPVFISSQNEMLGDCTDAKDEDTEKGDTSKPQFHKKKSHNLKQLNQIFQTTEDIETINSQLKSLLKSNNEKSSDEMTANVHFQQPAKAYQSPELSEEDHGELEYRLQQFKKRNHFAKLKEKVES